MLRGMVFVDHMNFNIALGDYYSSLGKKTPNLDYNTFSGYRIHYFRCKLHKSNRFRSRAGLLPDERPVPGRILQVDTGDEKCKIS